MGLKKETFRDANKWKKYTSEAFSRISKDYDPYVISAAYSDVMDVDVYGIETLENENLIDQAIRNRLDVARRRLELAMAFSSKAGNDDYFSEADLAWMFDKGWEFYENDILDAFMTARQKRLKRIIRQQTPQKRTFGE